MVGVRPPFVDVTHQPKVSLASDSESVLDHIVRKTRHRLNWILKESLEGLSSAERTFPRRLVWLSSVGGKVWTRLSRILQCI